MAELSPHERLLPSLLERLRDDPPDGSGKAAGLRPLTLNQLRDTVIRDLEWLLNATGLGSGFDTATFPNVARSVVNFGLPPLAGQLASDIDTGDIKDAIRDAIIQFEPRVMPNGLRVSFVVPDGHPDGRPDGRSLDFDIEGELWAQPVPLQLRLRTQVDLETGVVTLSRGTGER